MTDGVCVILKALVYTVMSWVSIAYKTVSHIRASQCGNLLTVGPGGTRCRAMCFGEAGLKVFRNRRGGFTTKTDRGYIAFCL